MYSFLAPHISHCKECGRKSSLALLPSPALLNSCSELPGVLLRARTASVCPSNMLGFDGARSTRRPLETNELRWFPPLHQLLTNSNPNIRLRTECKLANCMALVPNPSDQLSRNMRLSVWTQANHNKVFSKKKKIVISYFKNLAVETSSVAVPCFILA